MDARENIPRKPHYPCNGHNLRFFINGQASKTRPIGIRLSSVKRLLLRAQRHASGAIKRRDAVLSRLALKSQTVTVASISSWK